MKKLLSILLFLALTTAVRAQNMTFDETVKYINEKIQASKYSGSFTAQSNGKIDIASPLGNVKCNLFDLVPGDITDNQIIKQDKGIALWHSDQYGVSVYKDRDDRAGSNIIACFDNEKDAERLFNALAYLRSICSKVKDPFDK